MEKQGLSPVTKQQVSDFLVFLSLFLAYWLTVPTTVQLEDDGAFIVSAYFNGIAHPPGYPLYCLLGHLASQVDAGTVASRLHVMSGLFAAIACVFLGRCTQLLSGSIGAGVIAAMLFGFCGLFWSQAIIAEVYSLNALLFLSLLYGALLIYRQHRQNPYQSQHWRISICAMLLGLGLSNHWPLLLLMSPALFMLLLPALLLRLGRLPQHIIALSLGLLPYVWMYWRGQQNGVFITFGELANLSDWVYYISREGYSAVDDAGSAGLSDKLAFMAYSGKLLAAQFAWLLVLAPLGLLLLWRQDRYLCAALLFMVMANSVLLTLLLNFDFDIFHQTLYQVYPLCSFAIVAILIGLPLGRLRRLSVAGKNAGWVLVLGLTLINSAVQGLTISAQPKAWGQESAALMLAALPDNSTLLLNGDHDTGTLGYLHYVLQRRLDVRLYQSSGLLFPNRLFHPYKENSEQRQQAISMMLRQAPGPVFSSVKLPYSLGQRNLGSLWQIETPIGFNQSYDSIERLNQQLLQGLHSPLNKFSWRNIHQEMLALQLLRYYAESEQLAKLSPQQLQLLLQFNEAQIYYLALMLDQTVVDGIGLQQLVAQLELQLPNALSKSTQANFWYLKGSYLSRVAERPVLARQAFLRSLGLDPQKNPAHAEMLRLDATQKQ